MHAAHCRYRSRIVHMKSNASARTRVLTDILHVFTLTGFAIAQPIYDLLGKGAEFLVAHRLGLWGIFAFVAFLSVGLPAIFAFVELLTAWIGTAIQRIFHLLFVFLLATAFLAPLFNRVDF